MDALRTEVYAQLFLPSQPKGIGIFVKQAAHVYFPVALRGVKQSKPSRFNLLCDTFQGANFSLLGKGKLIFKNTLVGYILLPWRVFGFASTKNGASFDRFATPDFRFSHPNHGNLGFGKLWSLWVAPSWRPGTGVQNSQVVPQTNSESACVDQFRSCSLWKTSCS